MSLLTIVQEAAGSLNQPVPASVFGATVGDAVLWRNLAQREGRELAKRHDWQVINAGFGFSTTATLLQVGAVPADFDRFLFGSKIWNVTLARAYEGPADNATWQNILYLNVAPTVAFWRLSGNYLYINPAPTAGQSVEFLYASKNWCQSSGAIGQSAWAADSDTALIPEALIALGITWRWLRAKGMSYAEEMSTYEREVEKASGRDRGLNIMAVGGSVSDPPLPFWNGSITT